MADVTMPQLGETVTEGTITRWHKQVGDRVEEDEVLYEVSTDKVDSEVPAPAAGWLAEILVQEGETVDVGAKLAVISDEEPAGGSDSSDDDGGGQAAAAQKEQEPAQKEPAEQEQAEEPEPARAEANGSTEAPAETPGGPSPERGVEDEEAAEEVAARRGDGPAGDGDGDGGGARRTSTSSAPAGGGTRPADTRPAGRDDASAKILSPVVRRLIAENDLDPARITGSGAGGRITRADVLAVIDKGDGARQPAAAPAAPAAQAEAAPEEKAEKAEKAPAPPTPGRQAPAPAARPGDRDEVVAFSNIRRRTAEHMVRSLATSAHTLVATEVDYENVERVRRKVKDKFKADEGVSLSFLPFIARALVDAIGDFPHVNASVGDDSLIVHRYVNLGIAVDLSFEGLIVPVVRDADGKRLRALAREIADLANRARSKKLGADEVSGGTFTITNAGGYGTMLTVPIINQPQVAILSTDGVKPKPVAVPLPTGEYGVAVHSVGNLAVSFDHRAIDGAYAAAFLARVRDILETRDWSQEL